MPKATLQILKISLCSQSQQKTLLLTQYFLLSMFWRS